LVCVIMKDTPKIVRENRMVHRKIVVQCTRRSFREAAAGLSGVCLVFFEALC
jgi:hypothetical protein